ncbi:ionotropic receptor 21a [Bemisia tabaci]
MTILLYDDTFYRDTYLQMVVTLLLETFPFPLMHGAIDTTGTERVNPRMLNPSEMMCSHYVAFTKQLETMGELLAERRDSRIVFVTTTTKWMVREYLSSPAAKRIPNLLVISDPQLQEVLFLNDDDEVTKDINLYTHKFYIDSLGTSAPLILTTWRNGSFTRPKVDLFPPKFKHGFNGHRLAIAVAEQPPFVFHRSGSMGKGEANYESSGGWDGLEIRIVKIMAEMLNFTTEFRAMPESNDGDGPAGRVLNEIQSGRVEMGLAGLYNTVDRIDDVIFSSPHTQDCASFVTLTSTSVDRYRAVFGPFTGGVWIAMTLVYVFGIIPLSISHNHTINNLKRLKEWENMFWMVFGTFTNCFTFKGSNSWTSSQKLATRTFIAAYWVFTIIITAAYTGSIIAFITLPAAPDMIESSKQLLRRNFKVSILDEGGWQNWFTDLDDPVGQKLLNDPILVPDVDSGLRNVTRSNYLRHHAFLGSFALIEWYLRTNSTARQNMKAQFHLSDECFIPFVVSVAYNKRAPFVYQMNEALLRIGQAGYVAKFERDLEWEYYRLAGTRLLMEAAAKLVPEDRSLNIEDVSGVFILMAFGYTLANIILIFECLGTYRAKQKKVAPHTRLSESSVSDSPRPSIVIYEDVDCPSQYMTSDPSDLQSKLTKSMATLQPYLMGAINVRSRSC